MCKDYKMLLCLTVTSEGLTHLGRLHELEELYMSNNLNVEDVVLVAVSTGCPKLRYTINICQHWMPKTKVYN